MSEHIYIYIYKAYPVSNHLVDSSTNAPKAGSFPVDFRHGCLFDSAQDIVKSL